ncbi:hypothetical protein CCZ01_08565 [Helicobacter monodelphidis]|uniref:hypothetical protein n=1 Tax=Helicobacter sp. 15-1451 TaxID=2004995 RepID=UPI000DCC30BC|nr:hypothetical protein [Helicobacter sp. 15-1451]RAX56749.1 hypothetical protein CCZ01_08565 [Helicobacter sp. 15-1451]
MGNVTFLNTQFNVNATDLTIFKKANVSLKNTDKTTSLEESAIGQSFKQTNASSTTKVIFEDSRSGQNVSVELSSENLEKLKAKFGNRDLIQNQDGSVRLKGKAEELVSGWFDDIAYKRGYLTNDINKDGVLDQEESKKLKDGYGTIVTHDLVQKNVKAINVEGIAWQYISEEEIGGVVSFDNLATRSDTLAGALDKTLTQDSDLDGVIGNFDIKTQEEVFNEMKKAIGGAYKENPMTKLYSLAHQGQGMPGTASAFIQEKSLFNPTNNPLGDVNIQESEKSEEEELLEQQLEAARALSKLQQADGNVSALSATEREALQAVFGSTSLSSIQSQANNPNSDVESVFNEIMTQVENGEVRILDQKI